MFLNVLMRKTATDDKGWIFFLSVKYCDIMKVRVLVAEYLVWCVESNECMHGGSISELQLFLEPVYNILSQDSFLPIARS